MLLFSQNTGPPLIRLSTAFSLTSPSLSTKHIYPLPLASPCPLETSNPLMSITFFVTLSILSLLSGLLSDLSYCFPPLQSFLDPQLFLHCLLRKSAPWTHSAQLHDNSYHHIVLVIFPICFASSSLYVPWLSLKFRKHFPCPVTHLSFRSFSEISLCFDTSNI